MRISTSQMQQLAVSAILDQQSRVSKTQLQISTGRRVQTPADDPAAAGRILDLGQATQITEQYQSNADAARSRLALEEDAMIGVGNILQRIRELAVQGNNDSNSAGDRRSLALEVRQLLDQALDLANGRDANGEFIFAGYQGKTKPFGVTTAGAFSYAGDDGQRFLKVGPDRQVAIGDSGTEVFRGIKNGNGTFAITSNTANTGSGIVDPGTVADPASYVADTYSLIMAEQTAVTGGAIGITDANNNDVLTYELRVNGTLVYTGAEGSSRTQAQLVADINAQMGVTNVQAFLSGGAIYLANTAPTATPITVTENLVGATEDADTVTGYFGSSLTGLSTPTNSISFNDATGYVALDSASAIVAAGAYQSDSAIGFNGIETNVAGTPGNGDRFTISPSVNQDLFTTVQNLAVALEGGAAFDTGAKFHNAMNRFMVDIDQSMEKVLDVRARVGARLNAIDNQTDMNENFLLGLQAGLSEAQDLDYAEAVSRLNLQLVGLEAAQKSFIKVQGLSLFNFLR